MYLADGAKSEAKSDPWPRPPSLHDRPAIRKRKRLGVNYVTIKYNNYVTNISEFFIARSRPNRVVVKITTHIGSWSRSRPI